MKTLLVTLALCAYSIPATAIATVYDFGTGAGVDHFAFGESISQVGLPPSTNDLPAVPVTSSDYAAMAALDAQYHRTPVFEGGEGAAVRYVFTIDESAALVTQIDVSWDGGANEDGRVKVWAWNAANGYYANVGQASTKVPPGANTWRRFTTNAPEFVASDNTITLLAAYIDSGARVMTDYVSITVTQTSACSGNAECEDGLYCNGVESCDPVAGCQPGTPIACNDGLACTVDFCNEATAACDAAPDDAVCQNGFFCDGSEVCDPVLGCQPGVAINCDDGVVCTIDSCNEATNYCDNVPDNPSCFVSNRWYVDADATGANDGSSWANALNLLQEALAAAVYGDEIWVAAGTYKPDEGPGQIPGDRGATFQLRNGVAVYGHFLGNEATLGDRVLVDLSDPLRQTILSGDIGVAGYALDNSYHVVTASGAGAGVVLDAFTVTGGMAAIDVLPHSLGGGMLVTGGNPTVSNCTFTVNEAPGGGGAAVYYGNPTFSNCVFSNNLAGDIGGGLYSLGSDIVLAGCEFRSNQADTHGGGMADIWGVSQLTNCSFIGNSIAKMNGFGGGMYTAARTQPTLTNCLFAGNSAPNGGGMFNWGAPVLVNCTFGANSATYDGGGIFQGGALASATNSIFWGNTSAAAGSLERAQILVGQLEINFSVVEGWTGSLGGIGNGGADPLFADAIAGDYRLSAGSASIDAGDNTAVPAAVLTDLAGGPRFVDDTATPDTGLGQAPVVDIGAYEFSRASCLTDADCDDGVFCNGAETCSTLQFCQVGIRVACDDGVACTVDSCDEALGSCVNLPSAAVCDNGLFCDGAEVCDALLDCQAGAPVDCNDGVGCTIDSCNEATGSCDNTPSDAVCGNGVFCDGVETCNAMLGCQAGTAPNCGGLTDQCNVGVCDEAAGACVAQPMADGSACDNGDACTGDICAGGICQTAICGPPPPAPARSLKGGFDKKAQLEWKPSQGPNVTGYSVYRATVSSGPYTAVAVLGLSKAYEEFPPPGRYCYVVTAMNASGGESGYSNEVCGIVLAGG